MSDDEGYAPAAQMLICFIFSACVQKNTDSDDRCHLVSIPVVGGLHHRYIRVAA